MNKANEGIIFDGTNISLSFNGIKALDNLDFIIKTGQITSIIGPNGAGKTCLINCITGYYKPQQGNITFGKRNILGLKPYQIAKLGISRTFQDPTMYPSLTALDILMSGRYIHTNTNLVESLLFSKLKDSFKGLLPNFSMISEIRVASCWNF